MRLLDTTTLEFKEFFDSQTISYAILSHRWQEDETTYSDFRKRRNTTSQGYQKVVTFCRKARDNGYKWAWIDTCCIDKKSSAELSEAINSMMQWYQSAAICYAYLSDLPGKASHDETTRQRRFRKSAWFTRGWTLQELLAPGNVMFLDRDWCDYGTKIELQVIVSEITGIHCFLLTDDISTNLSSICVAEKMSWASRRVTSRKEDEAYCLMGLFGINMPLLYGEGSKAFGRLQQEILNISDDQSILAWSDPDTPQLSGFLAPSPACFRNSTSIHPGYGGLLRSATLDPWITFTSRGLHVQAFVFRKDMLPRELVDMHLRLQHDTKYIMLLPQCPYRTDGNSITMIITEVIESESDSIAFALHRYSRLVSTTDLSLLRLIESQDLEQVVLDPYSRTRNARDRLYRPLALLQGFVHQVDDRGSSLDVNLE